MAAAFSISVPELISGNTVKNTNISANMSRSRFYVCPVCGNILHGTGEAFISCHGITLPPLEAEDPDGEHEAAIDRVEDEYFAAIDHPMTREHHISFMAAVSCDRVQLVKLYPEGSAQARFKRGQVEKLYFYCNRDGLFQVDMRKMR